VTEEVFTQLQEVTTTSAACRLTGRSRATHYRRCNPPAPRTVTPRPRPARALSDGEAARVLEVLRSERFCDMSPEQVYPILLDEGVHLCSVSTMYRLLRTHSEVTERRDQATHPARKKPELIAEAPCEIWSWDVTKLNGPHRRVHFDLLVAIDIFSRYVPGWLVTERSNADVAKDFLRTTIERHGIEANRLTLHMDRGSEMTAKTTVQLLADLKVGQSFSRPRVSNDNPFSESNFKTLKYCPAFPERFGSIEDAREFCSWFFERYNHEHRHSGIGFHTPASVHFGTAAEIREQRATTLGAAYAAHPERFVKGMPKPAELPTAAWINRPPDTEEALQNI
jgi:putative transposase